MFLELKQSIAGARFSWVPGEIVEVGVNVTKAEAKNLIDKGYAVPYDGEVVESEPETKKAKK